MENLKELATKCEDNSLELIDELERLSVIKRSLLYFAERVGEMEHDLKEVNPHPLVTLAFGRIYDEMALISMAADQNTANILNLAKELAKDTSQLSLDMQLHKG